MKNDYQQLIEMRIKDLHENTNFMSALFDHLVGYAIIAADFDGNLLAYNQGAHLIYGYAPEEFIGLRKFESFFPRDFIEAGKLQSLIDELIENGSASYEGEKVRKNGEYFPSKVVFAPTKDKRENVVGFIEIVEDLTERKQTEQALRDNEARFRSLISQNADGILVIDGDGKVVFSNPAAERLLDRSADELLGELFGFPVVAGETTELDILPKSGERVVAEMRVVETEWEGEAVYLASLRDITERAQAEEEILTEKRRTEAILEHMADGLVMLDKDGRLVSINPAARRMLGVDGMNVLGEFIDGEGTRPNLKILALNTRSHQAASNYDEGMDIIQNEIVLEPPLSHTLKVFTSPVMDSTGLQLGEVKVLHDITREREVEQAKSNFISTISHELRTPLFSIQGFLEMILNNKVPDRQKRKHFLALAYEQSKHLHNLLDEILDISRIESGKLDIHIKTVFIAPMIDRVVECLQAKAIEKGVDLRVNLSSRLLTVQGDEERLEQVVTNLVDNAIKFTPKGGKVLIKGCVKGEDLMVQVLDNGIGIPAEALTELFQRFYQVDNSATREAGGSGLGLYISKQIIEKHGGLIWVESVLGRGSNFNFTIPLSPGVERIMIQDVIGENYER